MGDEVFQVSGAEVLLLRGNVVEAPSERAKDCYFPKIRVDGFQSRSGTDTHSLSATTEIQISHVLQNLLSQICCGEVTLHTPKTNALPDIRAQRCYTTGQETTLQDYAHLSDLAGVAERASKTLGAHSLYTAHGQTNPNGNPNIHEWVDAVLSLQELSQPT